MGICVSYGFVYNSVSISISPSVDLCINRASAKRRGGNHAIVTALPRNVSVRVLFDELELDFRSCRNTHREEPFRIIGIQQRFCAFIRVPTTQLRHITYNVNVFTVVGFSFHMENDLVLVTRQDIIGKRIADSIPFFRQTQSKRKSLYWFHLLTSDSAFKELKLFRAQEKIKNGFMNLTRQFNRQAEAIQWRYVLCDGVMSIIEQGLIAFTYLNLLVKVLIGEGLLGTTVAYINSIENVKNGIQQLFAKGASIVEQAYYLNFIFELVDYKIVSTKSSEMINIKHIESIEFVHVGFRYPQRKNEVLHDVNIMLKPGNPFIIVGANGSGKSTFLKLLGGYYLNYTGKILVNGYDLKTIDVASYREKMSILFQDFFRYEMTVMENVNIGQTGTKKSEKEIKILMKKYKMPDSICDNPKQQIGYWFENGVQLSGGQWQRLAICRTMARDNEILLLDEPNAALDAITFRMLYNEINTQAKRKVCVMLLQHFVNFIGGNEEICVFNDGRLISRGKHDKLYDTCRIYKELYDAQQ